MKVNIMRKWVKALRSGKFKQGRASLVYRDGEGRKKHCCLGVLCSLSPWKNTYDRMGGNSYLPEKVMKWAGISDNKGTLRRAGKGKTCLPFLNDHKMLTFEQIADIIEAHYAQL